MAAPRRVIVDDLAELRWAMEPALHPSTDAAAYVVSGPDADQDALGYDLYLTHGPDHEARLLARGARSPRWSPDGSRIAFLLRSGSRWTAACRTPANEEVPLETPPGDTLQLVCDPHGPALVAVVSTASERGHGGLPYRAESSRDWDLLRRQAWILSPGAEPSLVPDTGNVSAVDWSPDGTRLAMISDRGVDRDNSIATGLWTFEPASSAIECLIPATTPIRNLAWSPDGAWIAYLAAARDNAASALVGLWVIEVGTGERRQLAAGLDRSIGLPVRGDDERAVGPPLIAWASDSGAVLAIYAEGGRSRLARFDLEGGWVDVIAGDRCVLEFSSGEAGIAISWSDPVTPGEISLVNPATGSDTRITSIGEAFTAGVELAPTKRVSATASDGVAVEGWLTLPPDRPHGAPLVLQVHGGPHYGVGERFSFDAQRLAAQGIAVLRANPRGSQGYGQAYADGNLGDWGGRDFDDLLDLVDTAIAAADLDTNRIGIIGESYGGFMALWAAASSDRFRAAVVENGIADFLSSAAAPVGPTFWFSEMGGAPWENPTAYLERSPITRIDRVTCPVLVVHCEADTTCPISHGEAVHAALRALGRPVGFVRVPGEGHFFNVFGALSRRLERTAALDAFLVAHLEPGAPDADREEPPS